MNVPNVGGAAAPERSFKPARAERRHDEKAFVVHGDDEEGDADAAEPRDEGDDEDVRAQEARLMDLCAWMIPPAVAPDEGAPDEVDVTDPAAQFALPAPAPEDAAKPVATDPREPIAASRKAAPDAAKESLLDEPPASREESNPAPAPRAAPASDDLARAVSRHRSRAPGPSSDATSASARPPPVASKPPDVAAPDAAAPSPAGPPNPWAAAPSARGDNALTAVRQPTRPEAGEDAAAARARLHEAMDSTAHHRALRDVAHGELTVPGLGHIAVSARGARDAVDVEIRASQAATAYALHAQADALAADIRAADISVARLSFEGAGAWTPPQGAPSQQQHARDGSAERHGRDEGAGAGPGVVVTSPRARVRFVL